MSDSALARQYQRVLDTDAEARAKYDQRDKELRKLIRMAKMGRKVSIVIPISDSRGVQITDQVREFKKEGKLFAPAFARRFAYKEVPL
jgi:phosphatidylserine decarboxylase